MTQCLSHQPEIFHSNGEKQRDKYKHTDPSLSCLLCCNTRCKALEIRQMMTKKKVEHKQKATCASQVCSFTPSRWCCPLPGPPSLACHEVCITGTQNSAQENQLLNSSYASGRNTQAPSLKPCSYSIDRDWVILTTCVFFTFDGQRGMVLSITKFWKAAVSQPPGP